MGQTNGMGGLSTQGTRFSTRKKTRVEKMCEGEKGRGLRRREYVNGKVNEHVVYSQMNERVIGELILLF